MNSDDCDKGMIEESSCSERNKLALDRTLLANERTFLSYIRTAIMLFATGATLHKLFPLSFFNMAVSLILVGFSLFTLVFGVYRFKRIKKDISED